MDLIGQEIMVKFIIDGLEFYSLIGQEFFLFMEIIFKNVIVFNGKYIFFCFVVGFINCMVYVVFLVVVEFFGWEFNFFFFCGGVGLGKIYFMQAIVYY